MKDREKSRLDTKSALGGRSGFEAEKPAAALNPPQEDESELWVRERVKKQFVMYHD